MRLYIDKTFVICNTVEIFCHVPSRLMIGFLLFFRLLLGNVWGRDVGLFTLQHSLCETDVSGIRYFLCFVQSIIPLPKRAADGREMRLCAVWLVSSYMYTYIVISSLSLPLFFLRVSVCTSIRTHYCMSAREKVLQGMRRS